MWEEKNQTFLGHEGATFLALSIASPFPAQLPLMRSVHMDEVYG